MSIKHEDSTVQFSEEQLKYLESMFPERILRNDEPEAALREYFGQRQVVFAVRKRTRRI